MSTHNNRLHFLITRYIAGTLSAQELSELQRYDDTDIRMVLNRLLDQSTHDGTTDLPDEAIPSEALYHKILHDPAVLGPPANPETGRSRSLRATRAWWATGVAALVCIGILLFLHNHHAPTVPVTEVVNTTAPILPGGNKATLKLADGRSIALNETQSGIVINGNHITYTDGTELVDGDQPADGYLELYAPRGGTYHAVLDDGTEVWLNADSHFRYPSRFTGNQRVVELDGEAFFSVAKHPRKDGKGNMPFLVKTRFQTVEVLGTQFNVSAYADENVEHTTLIEGSVQITAGNGTTQQLYPNQQGQVTAHRTQISTVDINNFTAWKDGYFAFSDAHIRDVMKVIARWYDIDVDYVDDAAETRFGGTISRFSDFETLLETIALTGSVRFKITGRRVTVMT